MNYRPNHGAGTGPGNLAQSVEEPLPIRRERASVIVCAVRGDEQRVELEQRRDGVLRMLVARQVLLERHARGHARPLQLDDHQRPAVDEPLNPGEVQSAPVNLNRLTGRNSFAAQFSQSNALQNRNLQSSLTIALRASSLEYGPNPGIYNGSRRLLAGSHRSGSEATHGRFP